VWRRQVGFVRGTQWPGGQVRATWWHEQQDEVMDGFLFKPQNKGRAGTTWEPSHECESASRLLIILVIMTMQLGRINALNEMCAGFKVKYI
jgi:hypothetical protein